MGTGGGPETPGSESDQDAFHHYPRRPKPSGGTQKRPISRAVQSSLHQDATGSTPQEDLGTRHEGIQAGQRGSRVPALHPVRPDAR
eukprot:9155724-Heterocapsa_arctica.AAC.1